MPRVTSSWSRAEWLRRLGFKTGEQPPLASSIMPTLRSGDASELVPPLLAPQGYAGIDQAPVVGSHAVVEVRSNALGGTWVSIDPVMTGFYIQWFGDQSATYVPLTTPTIYESSPGVRAGITFGTETVVPASVPVLGMSTLLDMRATPWYVPPGQTLYAGNFAVNMLLQGSVFVRDVPVGLASD
jgi:hypothetical protein